LPPLLGSGGTGFNGFTRIRSDTTEKLSGENDSRDENSLELVISPILGLTKKHRRVSIAKGAIDPEMQPP
jgi:hypothetical protein